MNDLWERPCVELFAGHGVVGAVRDVAVGVGPAVLQAICAEAAPLGRGRKRGKTGMWIFTKNTHKQQVASKPNLKNTQKQANQRNPGEKKTYAACTGQGGAAGEILEGLAALRACVIHQLVESLSGQQHASLQLIHCLHVVVHVCAHFRVYVCVCVCVSVCVHVTL